MPLPKPTEAQRRALLNDALSPLAENERVLLFDALDALFESVLTDDALLHEDVDNPIVHHTTVLKLMMRIAKGEGFDWSTIRNSAAIAILHDMQPARKITREEKRAASTPEKQEELEFKSTQNRIIHMGVGSHRAAEKLREVNRILGTTFFTDDDISVIVGVIAVHDIPSIHLRIPGGARVAVAFREADRLWMQTADGVRADLARKGFLDPSPQQCWDQAETNLKSYRDERALYGDRAGFHKDTFFRTRTGAVLYEELRDRWGPARPPLAPLP